MTEKPEAKHAETNLRPLATREVFLDTEVYRSLEHDLRKAPLQALFGHIQDERIQLHVTDITLAEATLQIRKLAEEAAQKISSGRATLGQWRGRAPKTLGRPKTLQRPLNVEQMGAEAVRTFVSGLSAQAGVVHAATDIAAKPVFAKYFSRVAPFDGKSPKEFPDAFVIETLAAWCRDNHTLMYVVTNDAAMLRAAASHPELIGVRKLSDFLAYATIAHTPDIVSTIEGLADRPEFAKELGRALDEHIDELELSYVGELADGEAGEATRCGGPDDIDWTVISAAEDRYGLLVSFNVDLMVNVAFEDRSMASYDREDGVFIGAEWSRTEIEEPGVTLRMFVLIDADGKVVSSELLTREVEIQGASDWEDY